MKHPIRSMLALLLAASTLLSPAAAGQPGGDVARVVDADADADTPPLDDAIAVVSY